MHHIDGNLLNNDPANIRPVFVGPGRRARIMTRNEIIVLASIVLASIVLDGSPFAFADAGTVANACKQDAVTTFALVARVEEIIDLGITTADAKGRPTPGRGLKALQP